ncbi:MAG: peptide ABC transporter substrate-binding protein [Oscillospiraceae bacterium]|jgi:oligopeptide transport system substrate-binding protein|nr:peptide ABC transporter substrate-binding protein [Oscillospiraceae bacterium]
MKNLKKMLTIAMILALAISVAACASAPPAGDVSSAPAVSEPAPDDNSAEEPAAPPAASGNELNVCVGPNPDTIDPALNSSVDGATLIIHAFEGLYTLDENGTPIPGQAESVDVSEDGLVYTFHLRDGLAFSDGTPVTAQTFVDSWLRAINPETAADYAYMFESIAGYGEAVGDGTADFNPDAFQAVAVDEKTLEVHLVARTPYFLELTAFPTFSPVPIHVIDAEGEAWATKAETYIGNGPYKVTEWTPSAKIVMEKNESYWNFAALGPDKINFALIEDDMTQLTSYEAGELDFIDAIPQDEIDRVSAQPDYHKEGQLGTYYVSYNVTAAPFDNPLVRQAFTLAVDRDYIVTNIGKSGQVPAGAFVPIGLTDADPAKEFRSVGGDYYDPTAAGNEANLAKAKELLTEAGYPDGQGLPSITYVYNEGTGHQSIGEALQQMWGELGVTVSLESQEWATFLNTRKNGEYQVARNGWLGDYNDPISFLDMWITDGGNNDAQWSNTQYDEFISKIKNSGDQAERMQLMHEAEDVIFGEWMLCPIYYYVDIYMQKSALDGSVWASPLGYKYFMYAEKK